MKASSDSEEKNWPVGQAVKTPPSHGGNAGSSPARVTKKTPRKKKRDKLVGVDYAEGPPVPIPNTEVKLSSAEDTWLVTARENRKMPTFIYSSIAQSVERMTVNHDVTGSSPVGGAIRE